MTNLRPAVTAVVDLMPTPHDNDATEEYLDRFRAAMGRLLACQPLTEDEATALLPILDSSEENDLFGMTWTVLSAIETAPLGDWIPPSEAAGDQTWRGLLRRRFDNAFADPD
jgi:hypothetical protein